MARLLAALAALLLFGAASPAAAQPTMMCSGALKMNMGLVTRSRSTSGSVVQIAPTDATTFINEAECFADPADPALAVEIRVTAALPAGMQETFEVWVGSGCSDVVNRNGTTNSCEKVDSSLTLTDFWSNAPGGLLYQLIPTRALISPVIHSCADAAPTNSVYFIFYTDRNMPDNICSIALPSRTSLPVAPTAVTPGSGDGAIQLSWVASLTNPARKYQVLCAENGVPLGGRNIKTFAYSTSTAAGIQRKTFISGGTSVTGDGGVINLDAGFAVSDPPTSERPQGFDRGGASGAGDPDGGTVGVILTPGPAPFEALNHDFVCSEPVDGVTTRIENLVNGVSYQFLVVGIDQFGNPVPSAEVVTGTPQPVEDLYRRFRNEGGKAQGFCFIATAAYGSYESPGVQVLRRFRDEVLLPTESGSVFVDWYYRTSPRYAAWIATHPEARAAVRGVLAPVIGAAGVHLFLGGWVEALGVSLLLAGLAGLLVRRHHRRQAARVRSAA